MPPVESSPHDQIGGKNLRYKVRSDGGSCRVRGRDGVWEMEGRGCRKDSTQKEDDEEEEYNHQQEQDKKSWRWLGEGRN